MANQGTTGVDPGTAGRRATVECAGRQRAVHAAFWLVASMTLAGAVQAKGELEPHLLWERRLAMIATPEVHKPLSPGPYVLAATSARTRFDQSGTDIVGVRAYAVLEARSGHTVFQTDKRYFDATLLGPHLVTQHVPPLPGRTDVTNPWHAKPVELGLWSVEERVATQRVVPSLGGAKVVGLAGASLYFFDHNGLNQVSLRSPLATQRWSHILGRDANGPGDSPRSRRIGSRAVEAATIADGCLYFIHAGVLHGGRLASLPHVWTRDYAWLADRADAFGRVSAVADEREVCVAVLGASGCIALLSSDGRLRWRTTQFSHKAQAAGVGWRPEFAWGLTDSGPPLHDEYVLVRPQVTPNYVVHTGELRVVSGTAKEAISRYLFVLDRETGKQVWKRPMNVRDFAVGPDWVGVLEEHVVSRRPLFRCSRQLAFYDLSTGRRLWTGPRRTWAMPVHGGLRNLLAVADGKLVVFDESVRALRCYSLHAP